MKKRSLSLIVIISSLILVFTAGSASAGRAQHERWKGVAIGIGAAILGSAILNHNNYYYDREPERCYVPVRVPERREYYHRGHWEVRDEWVPPIYRTVWNPGHYTPGGDWIDGAWIKIVDKPGYWKEKRIWVSANRR